MTMSPADRPKVIGLIVAIVAIFAFIGWRFIGGAKPVVKAPANYDAALGAPSTSQIASGQYIAANTAKPTGENLNEVFAGMGSGGPLSNPFRMPVKSVKAVGPSSAPQGGGSTYNGPSVSEPGRDITWNTGGNAPVDPMGGAEGPSVSNPSNLMVKGIIAPEGGYDALAFIQMGDKGKGFRVGDEIAPGMKIVGITATLVSVRIGENVVKVGVGQEIKPE